MDDLSERSRLVLRYLISHNHVELLTPKMVARILKKVYSFNTSLDEAQHVLMELSNEKKAMLYSNLLFLNREISLSDYLELEEHQQSLVSCHFYPTKELKSFRKYVN
ncbi:hypothetical protein [Vibrio parahaemolyticus]|uniref:hypothetical protein n=1 Tax=Vibrio parahaemolyticus TaxID=670 RepID=UPI001E33FF6D|nr:hypothetical protein [Vibrio parahaemolyticus]